MVSISFDFIAASSRSFAEFEQKAGNKMNLSQKIDSAITCYYYAKGKEPGTIGQFAAIDHKQWTYKEIEADPAPGTDTYRETVSLELDDYVVEDIAHDFGTDNIADVVARAVHLYDRLLDTRTEGFDSAGQIDKKYPGHIRTSLLSLPRLTPKP